MERRAAHYYGNHTPTHCFAHTDLSLLGLTPEGTGYLPVRSASLAYNEQLVPLLLDRGADIDAKDDAKGGVALQFSAHTL